MEYFFFLLYIKKVYFILKLNKPNIVPTASAIVLLIAPPDNESKLALIAHAQALVPKR